MSRVHREIKEGLKYGLDEGGMEDYVTKHRASIAKEVENFLIEKFGYDPSFLRANNIQNALRNLEREVATPPRPQGF